jgi:hypothetical protein
MCYYAHEVSSNGGIIKLGNKSNEVLKGLVNKIIAASNGDTEAILKAIVEAEDKHQKNIKMVNECKDLSEKINSGDYLTYKDAAYKLSIVYLKMIADDADPDISDALMLVCNHLKGETKDLDEYTRIRSMQDYLKQYIKNCKNYSDNFMPIHHKICEKANTILAPEAFYNDLNYEIKLEAIYNMAKSSAFFE